VTAAELDVGAQMFARYAYAPNHLGFCGPPNPELLLEGTRTSIETAARQFTGAWPYLQVLSRMTGIRDPLDHRLVESYWLGGGVAAELDPQVFTDELLAVIGPQAGHYWAHLGADLAAEAAPNHCFHVFGVYPWSRLLGKGGTPELDAQPLNILDNCRISWGTVVSVQDDTTAEVKRQRLQWDGTALFLGEVTTHRVELGIPAADGDLVAVHWDRVCDRLTPSQARTLEHSTLRQLRVTNDRLRRTG
jgi:hypothetical protein